MFTQFSMCLYEQAAKNSYQLSEVADNQNKLIHWTAQKHEMATLTVIYLIDTTNVNFQAIQEFDTENHKYEENLLPQTGKITNLYILAGGEAPDFDSFETEEYFGQPIYSIFWHVDILKNEISVPKNQPKKLFDIRDLILSACANAKISAPENSFAEIKERAAALNLKPKHRHAFLSYAIILINALILGLMYLEGYDESNLSVPLRFGAIRSDLVLYGGEWFRLFNAIFIHFGFTHFFANAMGILIFGSRLERYLGRSAFLGIYIFSGLLGSVFSLANLYIFHPHVTSAGASGAVYGIVGAMLAFTRIVKRPIEFINWYVMLIYIGIGMVVGFATPGIDNFAHLGGLFGGIIIGGVLAYLGPWAPPKPGNF
ncbi:MAG: rhomboid family intramembrane serine protease [Defluviitaleaceae bacterium]|nr:rhomboid family intramembrane serine protease [Defluviitaleaceae bacterium]